MTIPDRSAQLALCCGFILASALHASTAGATETLFSLDLGSDKELSDPLGGAGETIDPGDIHISSAVAGSTAAPWYDDIGLFAGTDPWPVQGVPASACTAGSALFPNCFDLDGVDVIDFRMSNIDLGNYIYQEQVGPTDCVFRSQYLAISMDDDGPEGMEEALPPRAPTEDGPDRGSAVTEDELFGIARGGGAVVWAPISDEEGVHVDLASNPLPRAEDDDVDALDMINDSCQVVLFSADDEARLAGPVGLNPGSIYERVPGMGGAPTEVITFADIGTTPVTDVDAFELAWVRLPGSADPALALLFSVDQDRPSTAADESGGLAPGAIYASFLTGSNFMLIPPAALPAGDVDAIAANDVDLTVGQDIDGDGVPDALDNCILVANPGQADADGDGIGNICDADFTNNCWVDFADLVPFRVNFFSNNLVFDLDGDGTVGFSDIPIFRTYFLGQPGPSAYACP